MPDPQFHTHNYVVSRNLYGSTHSGAPAQDRFKSKKTPGCPSSCVLSLTHPLTSARLRFLAHSGVPSSFLFSGFGWVVYEKWGGFYDCILMYPNISCVYPSEYCILYVSCVLCAYPVRVSVFGPGSRIHEIHCTLMYPTVSSEYIGIHVRIQLDTDICVYPAVIHTYIFLWSRKAQRWRQPSFRGST